MNRGVRRGTPPGAASAVATTSAAVLLAVMGLAAAQTPAGAPPADPPVGVVDQQRAWQNWTLNCQGCHRPDGSGSEGTAPSLAGTVSKFLSVPGGREYLGRVPGVATSPLSNAALADLMNWMFWRFDRQDMPLDFTPFTADELARLRVSPLRLEAAPMRAALLRKAEEQAAARAE
jgi:cytochrome c553